MRLEDIIIGAKVRVRTRVCNNMFYGQEGTITSFGREDIEVELPNLEKLPRLRYFQPFELDAICCQCGLVHNNED